MSKRERYKRIEFWVHPDLTRYLDRVRGLVPRAAFVRSLVEERLRQELRREQDKRVSAKLLLLLSGDEETA